MSDLIGLAVAAQNSTLTAKNGIEQAVLGIEQNTFATFWEGKAGESANQEYGKYLAQLQTFQNQVATIANTLASLPAAVAQSQAQKAAAEALQAAR